MHAIKKSVKKYNIFNISFDFIDPENIIDRETLEGCIYEPSTTTLLKNIFLKNPHLSFIDVGAHYGYFSCFISKLSPTTKIFAFEPGSKQLDVLYKNININNSNVAIHNIALSDNIESVNFTDRTMKVEPLKNIEKVQCYPLDKYISALQVDRIFVKIDVHGAEGKVIYGMKDTLKNNVDVLMVEIHAANLLVDYTHREIMKGLVDSGLELYELADFRSRSEPRLTKIEPCNIENISNSDNWTQEQVNNERMIIGLRKGSGVKL